MCRGVQSPDANINDISNVRNSHACARVPALASRHVCRPSVSERSLQFPVFKEHESGFSAASVSNLYVCAQFRVAIGS